MYYQHHGSCSQSRLSQVRCSVEAVVILTGNWSADQTAAAYMSVLLYVSAMNISKGSERSQIVKR